jgi:hypothetical protein
VTLLPKAPAALLRFDAIQIQRPSANGNKTAVAYTQIFDGRGTLGTPSPFEWAYNQDSDRVVVVDQTLSLELGIDVRVNDQIVTPRGTFTVTAVAAHRLHERALLRKVG